MKKVLAVVVSIAAAFIGLEAQAPETSAPADAMYAAIRANDLTKIALLVDKGADVNARSAINSTALMWAGPNAAKVKLLTDRGADVTVVAENGRTALWIAAMSDESAAAVRLLLAKGADPRLADKTGATPLWAATFGNDTDTVRLLIAAGVDVNAADGVFGSTPLMHAAQHGNVDIIRRLLAKGANPTAVSGPPAQKVQNGIIDLGRFTPLLLAATENATAVKALLDGGAMPTLNTPEARGMTPLMVAASYDHADPATIKLLLSRGAAVAPKSALGETAIDWAKKSGDTAAVAMLTRPGNTAVPVNAINVPPPAPVAHRAAIERAVSLIERASGTFFAKGACGACHSQNIADIATLTARRQGISVNNDAAAQRTAGASGAFLATASRLLLREDTPSIDIPLYTLFGFAAGAVPADRATDALVHNIAAQQLRDGNWHEGGIPRPPIEDGDFSRTALAVRALTAYAIPGRGAELRERATRATTWLQDAAPVTNEDRSFRLLGLKWGGADAVSVSQSARMLMVTQRPDGGFAQRDEMASDAYATGQALYALLESGSASASAPAIQRGSQYLLSTQRADGSWYVRSRSPKFQPYFDGGFPYEHDQWISAMATGWSTAALALSLGEGETRAALDPHP
jgi:ankyrin repeat protein